MTSLCSILNDLSTKSQFNNNKIALIYDTGDESNAQYVSYTDLTKFVELVNI